jgi:4-amino-4-deoxy-L-arabinose transferase-like glycosyltransferase
VKDLSTRFVVFAACCFFILSGLAFIPYLGIQNDEALFSAPLYQLNAKEFCIVAFHHQIPLMVMTYIGTLKTLLYIPILAVFGGNAWSVRVPMLLCGALTLFLFFKLALRTTSRPAALIAGLLLATDPSFLLTNTVDWGPVALGHLFLVTGCLFLVRFAQVQKNSMRDLAWGFFFFGLALWNKALFFWVLAGLVMGSIVFWREIRRLWSFRAASLAAAAFLLGAFPFVLYNVRNRNETLKSTAHFDTPQNARAKFSVMEATLNGAGLFGYFTIETADVKNPSDPATVRGKAAWWIEQHLGEHRNSGMEYAMIAGFLLVPWWWRKRGAWFSLIFMSVAWLLMAFTRDAGGSVHHCVLLWPFPQYFVGLALGSLPWKRVALAAGAVLVAMNLLVLDKYMVDFERNGAGGVYSDAMFRLTGAIHDSPDPKIRPRVWVVDWGILNTLALTHLGRLETRVGDPPFMTDTPSEGEKRDIAYMFSDLDVLFVGHVEAREVETGVRKRLEETALRAGLHKKVLQVVDDSHGRPVFEIFKLVR